MTWLPPVRRGDVASLVERSAEPGTVVVCDGVFGGHPAVSHAELCDAIDAGWQVWGVSSIGAIRAYEMRHDGMHGFGYVYRQFARFADFTDDEMCLLHVPDPPYFPVTEALVNLRYALEQRQVAWRISDASAAVLLERLRAMWFGHRTAERMRQVMVEEAGIDAMAADALLAWTRDNRVKALDLAAILAARPWQLSPPAPAP
ncbi:MAG: TfuA-like protein [Rhizobacter sp.]